MQALPGQDATRMQKHIFRCYDENENGYIDFVEFMVKPHTVFYNFSLHENFPVGFPHHVRRDGGGGVDANLPSV